MAKAHVEPYNGSPAIVVDGKPCPPMTITLLGRDNGSPGRQAYYRRLGEAGLKIFYVPARTRWLAPGDRAAGVPDGVEAAIRDIRFVLDAVPDAYVMLRLNVSPPASWVNAHPEEQLTYSDGSHRPVICT